MGWETNVSESVIGLMVKALQSLASQCKHEKALLIPPPPKTDGMAASFST